MAKLIVNSSNSINEEFPISRLRMTIGRSARSDLCIADQFASRLHAEIRREGDKYWLQDLGSANGTYYDGSAVTTAVPIASGGTIRIGETTLQFIDQQDVLKKSATLITAQTQALDTSNTISIRQSVNPTSEILDSNVSSRKDLLGLISKVGVTLLSASGLDETLSQIVALVFEAVPANRCVIMLQDEENGEMRIAAAKQRDIDEPMSEVRIGSNVMEEVMVRHKAVLTSDVQDDPKLASQTLALMGVKSVLAVPLSVNDDDVFGIIYADTPTFTTTFSEEHLDILTTLASVASIKVQNASLTEATQERERMERELALAAEIQQRFQPSSPPLVDGYELQGISFACYEIGGDYYDFILRKNGNILIALGDVSGKGTAAALLMSSLHAAIHAQAVAERTLVEMVESVNDYLAENTPNNRFVTFFVAELNPLTGELSFINAGHNPPLVVRTNGDVEELDSGGFPLGIMPKTEFEQGTLNLLDGESLVVFSDGVSEAEDIDGVEYGMERLFEVVKNNREGTAARMRDQIESSLSSFTGSAPTHDDITLVVLKRITKSFAHEA